MIDQESFLSRVTLCCRGRWLACAPILEAYREPKLLQVMGTTPQEESVALLVTEEICLALRASQLTHRCIAPRRGSVLHKLPRGWSPSPDVVLRETFASHNYTEPDIRELASLCNIWIWPILIAVNTWPAATENDQEETILLAGWDNPRSDEEIGGVWSFSFATSEVEMIWYSLRDNEIAVMEGRLKDDYSAKTFEKYGDFRKPLRRLGKKHGVLRRIPIQ